MGFFSFVGNCFKAVGRGFGKVVEKVGEVTGVWAIESAGMDIQNACQKTSKKTGEMDEFDQNYATVEETVNVAKVLSDFSGSMHDRAKTVEQSAKGCVENYFAQLYDALDKTLEDKQALQNLNVQKQVVLKIIDGSFNDVLSSRVSLSDTECQEILKMRKGIVKEQKMRSFGSRVIEEGLDRLCERVKQSVTEICSGLDEELSAMVAQHQKDLDDFSNKLDELANKRQNNIDSSEDDMLIPAKKLVASELVLGLIQEG